MPTRAGSLARVPASTAVPVLVVLVCAAAGVPLLVKGAIMSHDLLPFHLKWALHFSEQLRAGDLYPRWLAGMNEGLGSPTFYFYGPLPYWGVGLLDAVLPPGELPALPALTLSASLALVASGATAYLWLGRHVAAPAAGLGAVAYALLPYHVFDLYVRFAYAEHWALVWLPLVLLFGERLRRGGTRWDFVGLSVSVAALLLTHVFTAVVFGLVPGLALLVDRGRHAFGWLRVAGAAALGVGLAAFYLLPAYANQDAVSIDVLQTGIYDFRQLFLFSDPPPPHPARVWRGLEAIALATLGLSLLAYAVARRRGTDPAEGRYWLLAALVAFFMMTAPSTPLWSALPLVHRVGIPWRFSAVALLPASFLLAVAGAGLFGPRGVMPRDRWSLLTALVLLGCLALDGVIVARVLVHPEAEVRRVLERSVDAEEYRPRHAPEALLWSDESEGDARATAEGSDAWIGPGAAEVWRPGRIRFRPDPGSSGRVTVRQLYFPGWRAWDQASRELEVSPSPSTGLIQVALREEVSSVRLELGPVPGERAGTWTSVASLAVLGGVVGVGALGARAPRRR